MIWPLVIIHGLEPGAEIVGIGIVNGEQVLVAVCGSVWSRARSPTDHFGLPVGRQLGLKASITYRTSSYAPVTGGGLVTLEPGPLRVLPNSSTCSSPSSLLASLSA
jgi:hypothetical protein